MRIPAIGLDCPVVKGGQDVINRGVVTWYNPGLEGPGGSFMWLAAHRSSHDGVFSRVPALGRGDTILLTEGGVTYRYKVAWKQTVIVDGSKVVSKTGDGSAIFGDRNDEEISGFLTLQTCDGADKRVMVYARLVD